MDYLVSQLFNPAFARGAFLFFLVASLLAFLVGIGLASRSSAMLRFMSFMNQWVSSRKWLKPAMVPHFLEPAIYRRPVVLGMLIVLGAALPVLILKDVEAEVFRAAFLHGPAGNSLLDPADAIKWFLLIGNGLCGATGLLMMLSPRLFSLIEACLDRWFSFHKGIFPLEKMHTEFDGWVIAHPTVSGIVVMASSIGMGAAMYVCLVGVAGGK